MALAKYAEDNWEIAEDRRAWFEYNRAENWREAGLIAAPAYEQQKRKCNNDFSNQGGRYSK